MPTIDDYLNKIPSEHRNKPRFREFLTMILSPILDAQALIQSLPVAFDLDTAVGVQLDKVGLWIGRTRDIPTPLPNVYFSFDDDTLGFEQGVWKGPFDPDVGLTKLDDYNYRLYLRAIIAANNWDGTMESAEMSLRDIFAAFGATVLVQDNQDMTMTIAVTGAVPNAVILALMSEEYLPFKPEGVRVNYLIPSEDGPLFGFDGNNSDIAGFDAGVWAVEV